MSEDQTDPYSGLSDDEIIEEEVEQGRSNVPMITMVVSLVVLATTVAVIGYFISSATTDLPASTETPSVQPTGEPKLPQEIGEYSRAPGGGGVDDSDPGQMTSTAFYIKNGQESMLIVAIRPAKDPRQQLEDIDTTNIVDYDDDARCGRDKNDLDICAVPYGNTLVVVQGLRDQSVDDMVEFAREVAPHIG